MTVFEIILLILLALLVLQLNVIGRNMVTFHNSFKASTAALLRVDDSLSKIERKTR